MQIIKHTFSEFGKALHQHYNSSIQSLLLPNYAATPKQAALYVRVVEGRSRGLEREMVSLTLL